jgi:hypothetical protein
MPTSRTRPSTKLRKKRVSAARRFLRKKAEWQKGQNRVNAQEEELVKELRKVQGARLLCLGQDRND